MEQPGLRHQMEIGTSAWKERLVNTCVILQYFKGGKATELERIPPLKMTVLKPELI